MLRVTGIDPGAITLATGSVNLRRFEQRVNETLVVGQLLDAPVRIADTGEDVDRRRRRDGAHPHPGLGGRAARRPGPPHPPDPARPGAGGRLARGDRALAHRPAGHRRPARGAWRRCVPPTSPARCTTCRRSAATRSPTRWTTSGSPTCSRSCRRTTSARSWPTSSRSAPRTSSRRWPPTTRRTCSASCPPDRADRLLELMEPEEAEAVRRLLRYSSDTAGGLMTTEPVILRPDATVAEALAHIRNPDISPALAAQVFVCRPPTETPTGRYLGCAHFQRLLREPPFELVAGVLDTELETLTPGRRRSPGSPATSRPTTWSAGPVVDDRGAPARRGHRRRRARPPAARQLAGPPAPTSTTIPRTTRRSGWPRRRPLMPEVTTNRRLDIPRLGRRRLDARPRQLRRLSRAGRPVPRHRPLPGDPDASS